MKAGFKRFSALALPLVFALTTSLNSCSPRYSGNSHQNSLYKAKGKPKNRKGCKPNRKKMMKARYKKYASVDDTPQTDFLDGYAPGDFPGAHDVFVMGGPED